MENMTIIASDAYCETLKKLRRAIQNNRSGMLTSGVVIFYDSARPHTAARTRALLEHSTWSCLTTLLTALFSRRAITTCLRT
jgi:hypothetical protein